MKSSMVVGLGLMFLGLVLWFAISREMDQWAVCRSLGHGRVYCFFAQGDHK